jgi:hypothetical protein
VSICLLVLLYHAWKYFPEKNNFEQKGGKKSLSEVCGKSFPFEISLTRSFQ